MVFLEGRLSHVVRIVYYYNVVSSSAVRRYILIHRDTFFFFWGGGGTKAPSRVRRYVSLCLWLHYHLALEKVYLPAILKR